MKALKASFGRAAADYERYAPVQTAMAAWLAEWLPEEREGDALELGAGTGLFTKHAQPWGGRYVASDASAGMVAHGRTRVGGVEWRELTAEQPGGGAWSWILSSSMLQWVSDPTTVLAEWRRALAPGGRVLAGFYVAETLPELRGLLGDAGPVEWRTHWAWREAFRAAGLRVTRANVARRSFAHGSARELLRSLHAVGAAPERKVAPGRLLAWLREQGETPMEATWTFFRCEAVADELIDGLP